MAAVVGGAEGRHADASPSDSIQAFAFACHTRAPARAVTRAPAVTAPECRGFTLLGMLLQARALVTKRPAAQQDLPVVGKPTRLSLLHVRRHTNKRQRRLFTSRLVVCQVLR